MAGDELVYDPTPDIDGYADHRAAVPDEHRALRLLRRLVNEGTFCVVICQHGTACGHRWLSASQDAALSPDEADLIRRLKENP